MDPFSVAELLVLNPMTSATASLMRMKIYITTNSIRCKPIVPSRKLYTTTIKMTMTRKEVATTSETTTMKATSDKKMTIMNRYIRNMRLGVTGTVELIVIRKN